MRPEGWPSSVLKPKLVSRVSSNLDLGQATGAALTDETAEERLAAEETEAESMVKTKGGGIKEEERRTICEIGNY